jgi:hypothetical protein
VSLLCAQRRELPTLPTEFVQGVDERLALALDDAVLSDSQAPKLERGHAIPRFLETSGGVRRRAVLTREGTGNPNRCERRTLDAWNVSRV